MIPVVAQLKKISSINSFGSAKSIDSDLREAESQTSSDSDETASEDGMDKRSSRDSITGSRRKSVAFRVIDAVPVTNLVASPPLQKQLSKSSLNLVRPSSPGALPFPVLPTVTPPHRDRIQSTPDTAAAAREDDDLGGERSTDRLKSLVKRSVLLRTQTVAELQRVMRPNSAPETDFAGLRRQSEPQQAKRESLSRARSTGYLLKHDEDRPIDSPRVSQPILDAIDKRMNEIRQSMPGRFAVKWEAAELRAYGVPVAADAHAAQQQRRRSTATTASRDRPAVGMTAVTRQFLGIGQSEGRRGSVVSGVAGSGRLPSVAQRAVPRLPLQKPKVTVPPPKRAPLHKRAEIKPTPPHLIRGANLERNLISGDDIGSISKNVDATLKLHMNGLRRSAGREAKIAETRKMHQRAVLTRDTMRKPLSLEEAERRAFPDVETMLSTLCLANRVENAGEFVAGLMEEGRHESNMLRITSRWKAIAARTQRDKEIRTRAAMAKVHPSVVRIAMKWKMRALGLSAATSYTKPESADSSADLFESSLEARRRSTLDASRVSGAGPALSRRDRII